MKRDFLLCLVIVELAVFLSFGHAVAQNKVPIVIGAVQPLTGWAALGGKNVVAGMKIALERIKSSGGILGRPFELVIEDGKAEPIESVNAIEKLLHRDKVPAIIGCWASSATLAAMPIMQRNKIPLLVETATAPMITEKNCHKCHENQVYKEGDIHVGISVSVPFAPYETIVKDIHWPIAIRHLLVAILGLAFLYFTQRKHLETEYILLES